MTKVTGIDTGIHEDGEDSSLADAIGVQSLGTSSSDSGVDLRSVEELELGDALERFVKPAIAQEMGAANVDPTMRERILQQAIERTTKEFLTKQGNLRYVPSQLFAPLTQMASWHAEAVITELGIGAMSLKAPTETATSPQYGVSHGHKAIEDIAQSAILAMSLENVQWWQSSVGSTFAEVRLKIATVVKGLHPEIETFTLSDLQKFRTAYEALMQTHGNVQSALTIDHMSKTA